MHKLIPKGVRHRFGRRGLILFLFGLAWMIQGSAYFLLPELYETGSQGFVHEKLPTFVMGGFWFVSGGISAVTSVIHPRRNDTIGYLAVTGPPMLLTFSCLVGIVSGLLTGRPIWLLAMLAFAIYGPITAALAVIASWKDPDGE